MKIVFLPDISFYKSTPKKKSIKKFEKFLKKLNKIFDNTKFIANLESVFLYKKTKPSNNKNYNLFADAKLSEILYKYNINNISLSNNHSFDFNLSGFLQTKKTLEKKNIKYFGAGKNLLEAKKPLVLKNFTEKCAIFGTSYKYLASKYKPGVFDLKNKSTPKHIASFKKKNKKTFTIVYCHSGLELFDYPLLKDEIIYKKFITAGADLVVGSHPHRTQGIEMYKKKLIFYSIGDIFNENVLKKDWSRYTSSPAHGALYKESLNKNLLFKSYLLEINTISKNISVYEIIRDKYFNYQIKKMSTKKLKKIILNYKLKLMEHKTTKYRKYIENKIF